MEQREQLARAKLVVVKVGTRLVTGAAGELNDDFLMSLVAQIKHVQQQGVQVLVVTSGAVHLGASYLPKRRQRGSVTMRQAAAAIGQPELMRHYCEALARHGLVGAQILLTTADMADRTRYLRIRNTLQTLLSEGVVPIINENDTVSVEGVTFVENDRLAAVVAATLRADLLIFLSDQAGLFTADPRHDATAEFVSVVWPGDDIADYAAGAGGEESRGGMEKKIEAAQTAVDCGIPLVIADGNEEDIVLLILAGDEVGTLFVARALRPSRKLWLATALEPVGCIVIDQGACRALQDKDGSSLLPVGITEVQGIFEAGDLVMVVDPEGREVGRGLVNYSREEIDRIKGRHSREISQVLGHVGDEEVIHRDNMVLSG